MGLSLLLRGLNVLSENADLDSFDPERFQVQDRIVRDGQRAGREFRRFLENGARVEVVVPERYIIDCRQVSMPREWHEAGWKVEWHRNLGCQIFTPDAVQLHVVEEQKDGRMIRGDKLRKILEAEPVLTDNWLDFLLANPGLIPGACKGKVTFFWGTGYRNPDGNLYVRDLYFRGGRWGWDYYWLDDDWGQTNPAAVLASP